MVDHPGDDAFEMIFEVFAKSSDDDGAKNVFEMIDIVAAIDSIIKASKFELSSRFFGHAGSK